MVISGLYLIAISMTIILAIIIVAGLRFYFSERERSKNEPYIVNMLYEYTGGHGILLQKEKESDNEEIHRIKCSPRDINYIELEEKDKKIENKNLFVRKDLHLPMGNSHHRNMFISLPDKPEDLPKDMDEDLRTSLAWVINKKNSKKDELEVNNLRESNMLRITKKTRGLDIYKEATDMYGEIAKDTIKLREAPSYKDK